MTDTMTKREKRKYAFRLKNERRRECKRNDHEYNAHRRIRIAHSLNGCFGTNEPCQVPDEVYNLLIQGTTGKPRGDGRVIDWY